MPLHVPHLSGLQRGAGAAVEDAVAIGAADGVEARAPVRFGTTAASSTTTRCGFMWKFSASRTVRAGRSRASAIFATCARGMHAGVGAAGGDACALARRRRGARRRPPAPPGSRRRCPGAASRRTRCRHIPAAARRTASAQPRPRGHGASAQKRRGVHRARARAPARASAATRRCRRRPASPSSSTVPGAPAPASGSAARIFSTAPSSVVNVPGQGFNARTRRSRAASRLGPVDPPVLAGQFRCIGARHRRGCGTGAGSSARARRISSRADRGKAVVQCRRRWCAA